jgi:kynurenine formamidase
MQPFLRQFIFLLILAGPAAAQTIDLSATTIIDLSHPFDSETIHWPTDPSGFELHSVHRGKTDKGFFYYANTFCAPEHSGTHLDAPMHFAEGRWTNSDIPIERFVGPAVVIDITAKAAVDPDYRLARNDVLEWEKAHGPVPDGAIVLLRTGWSARWPNRKAYMGDDTPGDASHLHFPSYGPDAAIYLVGARHVRMLGVDAASVDYGPAQDFPVHRILGAGNVMGLENLANLDKLPATGATLVALPMKIAKGSGAPTRVIAFAPR